VIARKKENVEIFSSTLPGRKKEEKEPNRHDG